MKTLIFNDVKVSKKGFYDAKQAIPLNLVDAVNIAVSNKIKNNNETSKYFIGYLDSIDTVVPLCISNILKMVERMCHLELKMMKYISNTIKYGIKLKNY